MPILLTEAVQKLNHLKALISWSEGFSEYAKNTFSDLSYKNFIEMQEVLKNDVLELENQIRIAEERPSIY